ncbi:excinuclease ABC subunit B [Candidatus Woesebacteria bacterium RIFCSPLOWO2_01_FULL_39_23]|uniref:UvrABC system protein B n=1 Tax=Candidatus Woesebacteria bacterium RIFCSPHIGHO2_01_FULL_40_22 TaxID=1802499 RepID=A0A1F7YLH0_9BACT|nr:MAG: excinuclease ABC subunit B [Candidatus Woesebacteria bacterium RBG_16_40_11]OGM27448.1 MAG: excinuclease ABC subunit B [Candidatus Woesebacteria bacterium RIFCSPHIGHO2_01_FULL_40_22]OGM36440.1 MAG: excinuclease ABC subunit B [Candidatus Woesebacteria bacterium RIFCSPHIGHO2_12_FULL_38_9]OGM62622.1 MAG: excinuclease ABC subunit B [Candidatus Woesebacteria bacterium RIFCSPLOWO2_01_FULL_39_23]
MQFKLQTNYKPIPDQEKAINSLVERHLQGINRQVLLGVTGSGKTFTVANVIERLQKPALILSHNKTLAAQLYQEFRDFFPNNAVSYFVSYYDFYQPEAYIPSTDTYIEKDADINELIDKLRLAATSNLLTRSDTIVVASVSCIYNIGSPREYGKFIFEFVKGMKINRLQIIDRLIDLQYERGDFGFRRGTFRVRGDTIDIYPAYKDEGLRIILDTDKILNIDIINTVTGDNIQPSENIDKYVLYPAKHYITDPAKNKDTFNMIESDLNKRCHELTKIGKILEAYRLKQRVTYDLEMIKEVGYVKGIENYSRYFDGRNPGDPPFTLLDYFSEPYKNDWLLFIDESHITFPQIRGMYIGDVSRKKTLIDYGFRLPAALDNRPLMFEEFVRKIPGFIATSATPSPWEINMANDDALKLKNSKTKRLNNKNIGVVQQLLRPTGIPDPKVDIRPTATQVKDVIEEIKIRANPPKDKNKERALITTLTKKTAEDLSNFLKEQGIHVHYLHSDIATLERTNILEDLRKGNYDCIVGVNLLREGLDLPEVSLVAILDADKEGFLRSEVSLTQTMGRAARHVNGKVILYADKKTDSMKRALDEIDRRRKFQREMNKKYGIVPKSIEKPIRERLVDEEEDSDVEKLFKRDLSHFETLPDIDTESLAPIDKQRLITRLRREMKIAAQDLNFELAAVIRDKIKELEL